MLSEISWQQYFIFLLVATLLYYVFVWIVIHKAKLSFFRVPKFRQAEDSPDEIISTAQHVIDELRPLFTGRTSKQELLYALKSNLKRYAEWDEPGFRETINSFIQQESSTKCSIRLEVEDHALLWQA